MRVAMTPGRDFCLWGLKLSLRRKGLSFWGLEHDYQKRTLRQCVVTALDMVSSCQQVSYLFLHD